MLRIPEPVAFEWDEGNSTKNWLKHKVRPNEAEEVFFDPHKRVYPDPIRSATEKRGVLVGKTQKGRILFLVYTIRDKRVRIISARDLNKKRELSLYEETN